MPPSLGQGFNMKSIIEHDRWLKNLASRPPLKGSGSVQGRNSRVREEEAGKSTRTARPIVRADEKFQKENKTYGKTEEGHLRKTAGRFEKEGSKNLAQRASSFEEAIENTIKTETKRVSERLAASNMETKVNFFSRRSEHPNEPMADSSISFGRRTLDANDMQTTLINNFLFAKETLKQQQMFQAKKQELEPTKKKFEIAREEASLELRRGGKKPIPGVTNLDAVNVRDLAARKIQKKYRQTRARRERRKQVKLAAIKKMEIEDFADFADSPAQKAGVKVEIFDGSNNRKVNETEANGFLNVPDEKLLRKKEKKIRKEQEYEANKLRVLLMSNKPKPYQMPSDNLSIVNLFKKKNPGRLFQIVKNQEGELKEVSSDIVTEQEESDETMINKLKTKYKNVSVKESGHDSKSKNSAASPVPTEFDSSEQEKTSEKKRDLRASRYSSVRESIYEAKDMNASIVSENIQESIGSDDKVGESIRESMQYHSTSNPSIKEESNLMASKVKDGSIDEEIPMSNSYVYEDDKFESISSDKAGSKSFGKKENINRQSIISSSKGDSFGGGFKKSVTFEEHSMNTEEVGIQVKKPLAASGLLVAERQKMSEDLLREEKEIFEIKSELLTALKQMNATRYKYQPEYLFQSVQPRNPAAYADLLLSRVQVEISSANHAKIVNDHLEGLENRFHRLQNQADIVNKFTSSAEQGAGSHSVEQERVQRSVKNIEMKQEVIMKTLMMMMGKLQETKSMKEQLNVIQENHEKTIEILKTIELQKKVEQQQQQQQQAEFLEQLRRSAASAQDAATQVDPKPVSTPISKAKDGGLALKDVSLQSEGDRGRIKSPLGGESGKVPLVKTFAENEQKKDEYDDDFNESAVTEKSVKKTDIKPGLEDTEEIEEEYAEDFESSASKSGLKSASGSWLKNSQSLPYEDEKGGEKAQAATKLNKGDSKSSEDDVEEEIASDGQDEEVVAEASADKEANMAEMSISWQPNAMNFKKKTNEDPGAEITEALVQEIVSEIKNGQLFPTRDARRLKELERILDSLKNDAALPRKSQDDDDFGFMGGPRFNREELARELAEAEESFGDSSSGNYDKRGYADEVSPTKLRKKKKKKNFELRVSMDNEKFCKEFDRKLADLELLVKTKDREELKKKLIALQNNIYGEFNLIENFEIRTKDENEKLMLKSFNEQMKLKILKTMSELKAAGKGRTTEELLQAVLARNSKNVQAVKKILLKRATDETKVNTEIYDKMDKFDKSAKAILRFAEVNRQEGEEEENLECLELEEIMNLEAEKKGFAEFVFDEVIRDTVAEIERIAKLNRLRKQSDK